MTTSVSSTIPERLLAVREAEGLALRPFAERLTVEGFATSAATVGGYENGRTEKIPADYVAAVCRVFGCSPAWLLSGEGPIRQPPVEVAVARLEAIRAALAAPVAALPAQDPALRSAPSPETSPPEIRSAEVSDAGFPVAEVPRNEAPSSDPFEESTGPGAALQGVDFLIELVSTFVELISEGGEDRRDDGVRLVDHIATRLADARLMNQVDWDGWRTYVAGAAPGHGDRAPETVLAKVLGTEELRGPELQHLMYALGERLLDTSDFALATACHGLAFLASERAGDLESACDAARRKARCHKLAAEWADSEDWYHRALELAERLDDWPRYGQALRGFAWLQLDQGATADARLTTERLMALGKDRDIPECVATANHLLSDQAHQAGALDDGIWHAWQAAAIQPAKENRLRAIFQVGMTMMDAGYLDAAEDAYRIAGAGIRDLSTRLAAMSGLALLAAFRGDGEEYDRRLKRLDENLGDNLSNRDQVWITFDQAKAHAVLGRTEEARRRFQETLDFAEKHGFNRDIIQADEALTALQAGTNPWASESVATEGRVHEVALGLRKMLEAPLAEPAPLESHEAPGKATRREEDVTPATQPEEPSPKRSLSRVDRGGRSSSTPAPELGEPDELRQGADFLLELVSAFIELISEDRGQRRADAVRLVDHIATRLADAQLLDPAEHDAWRIYLAGAAPGQGVKPPEAVLAEVLDSDEPLGADLQHLMWVLGERLLDTSDFALAVACHGLAFLASERAGDHESACDAAWRRARCHKLAAEWTEAEDWYHRAMELAQSLDDWRRYGHVLMGFAWLRLDQGATADAQRITQRLMILGEERDVPTCVAFAHHLMARQAYESGELDDAIWHGWQAAGIHTDTEEKLRALCETGQSLQAAGHLDAAEYAYQLGVGGIRDLSSRLLTMSMLAWISAVRGDGDEYDRRLERLEVHGPDQVARRDQVQIGLEQAKAHAVLGRVDEARRRFHDTLQFAERHGFTREAILADEGLAILRSDDAQPWPAPAPVTAEGRSLEVEIALRKMVETGSI